MQLKFEQLLYALVALLPAISNASATCQAWPYTDSIPGCISFTEGMNYLIDSMVSDQESKWVNEIITPIANVITNAATKSKWTAALGIKFCMAEFQGSSVTNAPRTGVDSSLRAGTCNMMPLNSDSKYSVLSFSVSSFYLQGLCQGLTSSTVSFCLATSVCDKVSPTVVFSIDQGVYECLVGNGVITSASLGISKVISTIGAKSLDSINVGLSMSADLRRSLTLWDGSKVVPVIASGNIAMVQSYNFDTKSLGLPSVLSISGSGSFILSLIGDAGEFGQSLTELYDELESATNIADTIDDLIDGVITQAKNLFPSRRRMLLRGRETDTKALYQGLSLGFAASVYMSVGLKDLTYGAFPSFPALAFEGDMFLSLVPKEKTGVDPGFYALMKGGDLITATFNAFVKTILPLFAGIIDKIFGDGASEKFFDYLSPGNTDDTALAFSATDEFVGLYFESPIGAALKSLPPFSVIPGSSDWLGGLKMYCKIKYSGDTFSCSVNYIKSEVFTAILKKGLWVIKKTADFFEDVGDVVGVAAVSLANQFTDCSNSDTFRFCGIFQPKMWKSTAEMLDELVDKAKKGVKDAVDAVKDLPDEVIDWIPTGKFACGTKTVSKYVTSAAECGYDTVTDAAKCGTSYVGKCVKSLFKFKTKGCKKTPKTCKVVGSCWVQVTEPKECS